MEEDSRILKGNRMKEQIGRLVCQLYGLTEEEIGIDEGSVVLEKIIIETAD